MTDKQSEYEHDKWKYELDRAAAERAHDQELDFFNRINEATVNAGVHVVRGLIIINGGAAITVLAFIGHLVSADSGNFMPKLSKLTAPLEYFAWGVGLASAATALAYLTNYSIACVSNSKERTFEFPYLAETRDSKRWYNAAVFFQVLAVLSVAVSLGLFIYGMLEIKTVISGQLSP